MPNPVRFVTVAALLLGGCTSLKHPVPIDWEHGAKRGTITQIFDANTPTNQLPACLANLPASALASHRYAEIVYPHRRHSFREVGALPAGVDAKAGDQVEFYPKNCDNGTLSTIVRGLPLQ